MRKVIVVLAIIAQVAVLAFMAGKREYVIASGESIRLRTAPLDPRDPFRGDFVRLNYAMTNLGQRQIRDVADINKLTKGTAIYAILKLGANGLAQFDYASLEQPDDGLYLRGRVQRSRWRGLNVKYGIETYFVEQGQGKVLEQGRGNRNSVQLPLEMEIAVGGDGTAILTGHRWSLLGIGLEILRDPNRQQQQQQQELRTARVKLTLQNASDQALALVALPNDCSFVLQAVNWSENDWKVAADPCTDVEPSNADVVLLQPQQAHEFELNLADPRWHVSVGEAPVAVGTLSNENFRLYYRPPPAQAVQHLAQKDLIWHGHMPSRAFNGRGRID